MIFGLGTDIIEIGRIRNAIQVHGNSLLARLYTEQERKYCTGKGKLMYESFAGRFAAKEAVFKGLKIENAPFQWQDIEIISTSSGRPEVKLYGILKDHACKMGVNSIMLSISHCREYAVASAIVIK